MPYIKPEDRPGRQPGFSVWPTTPGHLNYQITYLLECYLAQNKMSYQAVNDILGALEGAKLEFYRRIAAPYENAKLAENGDVYGHLSHAKQLMQGEGTSCHREEVPEVDDPRLSIIDEILELREELGISDGLFVHLLDLTFSEIDNLISRNPEDFTQEFLEGRLKELKLYRGKTNG